MLFTIRDLGPRLEPALTEMDSFGTKQYRTELLSRSGSSSVIVRAWSPTTAGLRASNPAPTAASPVPESSPLLMGFRRSHVPAAIAMGVTETSR